MEIAGPHGGREDHDDEQDHGRQRPLGAWQQTETRAKEGRKEGRMRQCAGSSGKEEIWLSYIGHYGPAMYDSKATAYVDEYTLPAAASTGSQWPLRKGRKEIFGASLGDPLLLMPLYCSFSAVLWVRAAIEREKGEQAIK